MELILIFRVRILSLWSEIFRRVFNLLPWILVAVRGDLSLVLKMLRMRCWGLGLGVLQNRLKLPMGSIRKCFLNGRVSDNYCKTRPMKIKVISWFD